VVEIALSKSNGIYSSLVANRFIIHQLARREILSRYRGTIFGILWSLLTPMLMLAIYTFVFGFVLEIRWPVQAGGHAEFASILFSGMIMHSFLSECLMQSTTLITGNSQYVKKVVFPLEALAWVTTSTALFQSIISIAVLFVYLIVIGHEFHWVVLLFPLPVCALYLMCIGIVWFVSAAAVYLKDLGHIMGVVSTILFFMAPILYPKDALPNELLPFLYLNPITYPIEQLRDIVLWNQAPDFAKLSIYLVSGFLFSWVGLLWFHRARKGFADVL
jgi:lipopolysaccharide transport system permease protein